MSKKKELTTPAAQAKSLKAASQLRDAKGHFIKGYRTTKLSVDPGAEGATVVTVVNTTIPGEESTGGWYKKLAEVADKLTVVISSLDKLSDFKDYISSNKKTR